MTSYCEVFIHSLATYAPDHIMAEADMDMMNFKQPVGQSSQIQPSTLGEVYTLQACLQLVHFERVTY